MMRLASIVILVAALSAALVADTLVLRNGTRLQGELIAVRNGIIEFEEAAGFGRGRRIQIARDEVLRIELDAPRELARNLDAGRRPAGLRERQVTVLANTAWTDTGIDVRSGQTIYVEASGRVQWGRDRRDGPGGERNSPVNPNRPMPNRPAAALIGRIGDQADDYFFVGDEQGPIRLRSSGRLYLGINDDFIADNSGSFRVLLYY